MTAELVLLLVAYAIFIMGVFFFRPGEDGGIIKAFHNNLPRLSARVERNIATGWGFQDQYNKTRTWTKPPARAH